MLMGADSVSLSVDVIWTELCLCKALERDKRNLSINQSDISAFKLNLRKYC